MPYNPFGLQSDGSTAELDAVTVANSIPDTTTLAAYKGVVNLVCVAGVYWKYDASSAQTTNPAWCINATGKGGGQWLKQNATSLNLRSYGALGLGDKSTAVDTAAFKAALADAANARGTSTDTHSPYFGTVASIYVPTGWYLVNDSLPVSGAVRIHGDGGLSYGGTEIQMLTGQKHLFTLTGEHCCVMFERLRLKSAGNNPATAALIYGGAAGASVGGYNSIYCDNVWFQGPERYSVQIEKGDDLVIVRCTFDGSPNECIKIGSKADPAYFVSNIVITANTFFGIPVGVVSVLNLKNLIFTNNRVYSANSDRTGYVIDAQSQNPLLADNILITGNITDNCDFLFRSNISAATVTGNTCTRAQNQLIDIGGGGIVSGLVCTGNTFKGTWSGNLSTTGVPLAPVMAFGTGLPNSVITDNYFENAGTNPTAIYLADTRSTGTVWGSNAYKGFSNPVVATLPPDGTDPSAILTVSSGVLDVSKTRSTLILLQSQTGPITSITPAFTGQVITLFTDTAISLTAGSGIRLRSGVTALIRAGESITLRRLSTSTWIEVSRSTTDLLAYTPTSAGDTTGSAGDLAFDNNQVYAKTATGWRWAEFSPVGGPKAVVYDPTEAAIKAAFASLPASGGVIQLYPGSYPWSGGALALNKPVTIDGGRLATIVCSTIANPVLQPQSGNLAIRGINFSNTVSQSSEGFFSMIHGFEGFAMDGVEIGYCSFTAPNANVNAITFTPYSPTNESGTGVGNLLNRLNVHHCYFNKIGRCAIEINLHLHADNKPDTDANTFLTNARFNDNTFNDLGGLNGRHGMAISIGGPCKGITVRGNHAVDCNYAAYEFVGTKGVSCSDNTFDYTMSGRIWAAYAVSKNTSQDKSFDNITERLSIRGGGGKVSGRAFFIFDAKGFDFTGGVYESPQQSQLRSQKGTVNGAAIKVIKPANDPDGNGNNALSLSSCKNVNLTGCVLELSAASGTIYSVLDMGSVNNNNNCNVIGNNLIRPASASGLTVNDNYINSSSTGSGSTNTFANNMTSN